MQCIISFGLAKSVRCLLGVLMQNNHELSLVPGGSASNSFSADLPKRVPSLKILLKDPEIAALYRIAYDHDLRMKAVEALGKILKKA
jgi:hypothetical protein